MSLKQILDSFVYVFLSVVFFLYIIGYVAIDELWWETDRQTDRQTEAKTWPRAVWSLLKDDKPGPGSYVAVTSQTASFSTRGTGSFASKVRWNTHRHTTRHQHTSRRL